MSTSVNASDRARRGRGFACLAAAAVCALALLPGCTTPIRPAPVVERSGARRVPTVPVTAATPLPREADSRPATYFVKRGETLYQIALDNGLDYRELAAWNRLADPNRIYVGQELTLRAPTTVGAASAAAGTTVAFPPAEPSAPVLVQQTSPLPTPTPTPALSSARVLSGPKAERVPYSEQALARLSAPPAIAAVAKPEPEPLKPPVAVASSTPPVIAVVPPAPSPAAGDDDAVVWAWPAAGRLVAGDSDGGTPKGIAIAGKTGQPVSAAAPGRVVYSGAGLRGYGKLIIIKHNKEYLSVYAHNSELLVKEGDNVTRGQRIAEMGGTDSDIVKLHFEIRRYGKPTDPLKLLPDRQG